jgi:hypothetical protein
MSGLINGCAVQVATTKPLQSVQESPEPVKSLSVKTTIIAGSTKRAKEILKKYCCFKILFNEQEGMLIICYINGR